MNTILLIISWLLALYAGALATFGAMALLRLRVGAFLFRVLAAYGSLVLCALYGVGASIALRLVGRHRIAQWATGRAFQHTMRWTVGVRFRVVAGQKHLDERPVVFVGNHQSALDVLMLGTTFPKYCSVTAKKSLRRAPFLGWFMALSGTVFIDRGNRETARKAFEGAATEIREQRQSVFIFPEGTRSRAERPMLLPFKKGAFHLAVQAKVPIVPVVTACYAGLYSQQHWRYRAGDIPVIVLPPIPTAHLDISNVDELCDYTRERMLKAVTMLTESSWGKQSWLVDPPPLPASTAKADVKALEDAFMRESEAPPIPEKAAARSR